MPKTTEREGPLGFFNIHFVAKLEKKLKGDPLVEKNSKSHNAEKLKGRALWDFSTSILSQNTKKSKGDPLVEKKISKKVAQCQKQLKRRTLWDFSKSILSQNSKKLKGDPLVEKKSKTSRTMP